MTLALATLLIGTPLLARGTVRVSQPHTVRFLAEHTNAILKSKCRAQYASLSGSRRLWLRRHLLAHRAKRGTCAPPTPWPSWWYGQAMCIHHYEGAWNADTGNGYGGGFQFLPSTFNRAAARSKLVPTVSTKTGTTEIARLSPFVQTLAAFLIWRQDGGSWSEWGTAGMCGLA